jgi:hypothetical protein
LLELDNLFDKTHVFYCSCHFRTRIVISNTKVTEEPIKVNGYAPEK